MALVQQELRKWYLWKYPKIKETIDLLTRLTTDNLYDAFLETFVEPSGNQNILPEVYLKCIFLFIFNATEFLR